MLPVTGSTGEASAVFVSVFEFAGRTALIAAGTAFFVISEVEAC